MAHPFNQNRVSGIEKQHLVVDTHLSVEAFTLCVALPPIHVQEEKLHITILGDNLTINYEFQLENFHSQSRIITLPAHVDRDKLSTEFENRTLRLVLPINEKREQEQDSVIFLTFPEEAGKAKKELDLSRNEVEEPLVFLPNPFVASARPTALIDALFSESACKEVREFHATIPGFETSPLVSLPNLARMLGIRSLWVKDESKRLQLNAFKVLGGSYAIAKTIQSLVGDKSGLLRFEDLTAERTSQRIGEITFAAATDGNHGKGVAWAAAQLGYRSVIYVHKLTSQARIQAIEKNGAEVVVVNGTYDDAVRQVNEDAQRNGWMVISDTAWEGYEDIPRWVMQGYTTMFSEAQSQLAEQGIEKPSHILVQAGVGALAAATIGFYAAHFGPQRPRTMVVEPNKAACLFHSIEIGDGQPHSFGGELDTIMAGLACGDPNPLAWPILKDCTDYFLQCPDYVAAKGMRVYGLPLKNDPCIISGESGAVTLGALMFLMQWGQTESLRKELQIGLQSDVLLINSEGNTDPDHFRNVVWDGGESVPAIYKNYWP